jgi:hypothetical protein
VKPPRQSSRAFVRLPAWITDGSSRREYVAFVRDISSTGAFFYAEFNPQHGQCISIDWNIGMSATEFGFGSRAK